MHIFRYINKTNSAKKESNRPNTAATGPTTLSARNYTTRASSRGYKMRLKTASNKSRVQSRQVRLFSAEGKYDTLQGTTKLGFGAPPTPEKQK